jgi:RNA polymerase sigma factor (sigma-70 family)
MEDVAIAPHDAAPHEPVPSGPIAAGASNPVQRSPEQAQQLVLDLIAAHADSLLRTARRYSLCAEDAQDAYQRGLEILLRHAGRLDADRAGGWLHTVVKHEAIAINRMRSRSVEGRDIDFDAIETRTSPSPEDRVLAFEQVSRSAEALQRLKPQEVRALWLKAAGNSYQEICDATGWSYTKVNRCLAEGRKSFLSRYAGIEAGEECRRWAPVLSAMVDGEAGAEQLVELRPHLRNCASCRAAVRELRGSNAPLAALFPIGGVALMGDGGAGRLDGAGDFLNRLWHMLWGDLSDRAATAAFRAQSVAQAIVPGKSMAVFASVAALAGGGFAIDEAARDAGPARAALEVPSVSTAADRITRAALPATTVTTVTTSTTPTKPKPKSQKPRARRRPSLARHRAATTTAAVAPAPAKARRTTTTPRAAAATPAARPAAATAPERSAATRSTTGSGEFGLESH